MICYSYPTTLNTLTKSPHMGFETRRRYTRRPPLSMYFCVSFPALIGFGLWAAA